MLRNAIRYGLISGALIVIAAYLKSELYLTDNAPDLYITIIAISFLISGMYFYKLWEKLKNDFSKVDQSILLGQLSKREMQVLHYLYTEAGNKELADVLNISNSTLKTHINSIYRKLNVKNRKELASLYSSELKIKQL